MTIHKKKYPQNVYYNFLNENHHTDKTNAYNHSKISPTKHFTVKKTLTKNLGFHKKSRNSKTYLTFFKKKDLKKYLSYCIFVNIILLTTFETKLGDLVVPDPFGR